MLSLEHEMFINNIDNIYPVSEITGFEIKENVKDAAKSIKDKIGEVIKALVKKIKEVFDNIKKNIRKKLNELYMKSYYKDAKKDFKKTGDAITYGFKLLRKYKDNSELNNYIKNMNISTLDIKKVLALKDIYKHAFNDYIPRFEAAAGELDNHPDDVRASVSMYAGATTPGGFPELDKYKEKIELKTADSISNFDDINYYLSDKIITDINETIDDIEEYEKKLSRLEPIEIRRENARKSVRKLLDINYNGIDEKLIDEIVEKIIVHKDYFEWKLNFMDETIKLKIEGKGKEDCFITEYKTTKK
jgi:hypothetical protein